MNENHTFIKKKAIGIFFGYASICRYFGGIADIPVTYLLIYLFIIIIIFLFIYLFFWYG